MSALRRLSPAVTALVSALTSGPARSAPGDLDLQFGSSGWVSVWPGRPAYGGYMAVQPDGKIVLGGATYATYPGFMNPGAARLHPDGTLDTSLGGTGFARINLGDRDYHPHGMVLQPDGKIIVEADLQQTGFPQPTLVRFDPDGTVDGTFGINGVVKPALGLYIPSMAVQGDGKILLSQPGQLFRLLSNGSPDPSFGTGGVLDGLTGTGFDVMIQPDGRILLRGANLMRLNPDGSRDAAFGAQGTATLPFETSSLALQSDGKIVVGGFSSPDSSPVFKAARLLPNGTLDATFNGTGQAGYVFATDRPANATKVLVQSDGKVLLTGYSSLNANYNREFAIMRLNANGSLDTGFGLSGKVISPIPPGYDYSYWSGAALQANGRLLVSGNLQEGPFTRYIVARYIVQEGPFIAVEQPAGTGQSSRTAPALDFGIVTAGSRTNEFTVRNNGTAPLVISSVSVTAQSHPGQFAAGAPGVAAVAPGALTTFPVTFTPSGSGTRTGTLTISSNGDIASFLIPLTGRLATALEIWRVTWFGTTDNSGPGADLNDFDGDGLGNLFEFAAGTNPHVYTPVPGTLTRTPGGFDLVYTRSAAALANVSWQVESADAPNGPWTTTGITSTVIADDATVQTVKAAITAAGSPRRFARMRVILAP